MSVSTEVKHGIIREFVNEVDDEDFHVLVNTTFARLCEQESIGPIFQSCLNAFKPFIPPPPWTKDNIKKYTQKE